ncbi:hypothetical protein [Snodgrassella communis]|uniref:hypothetical protein n=1 Tax=Snodgrassella communis TaxID=2946699 RepID=UPI001EF6BC90|nr:hypothetical protein [Snodgrassella communis]
MKRIYVLTMILIFAGEKNVLAHDLGTNNMLYNLRASAKLAMKTVKYLCMIIFTCISLISYADCEKIIPTLISKLHHHYFDSGFKFTACKVWPADPTKTIIALALTKDEDRQAASFDLDVLVVDSRSGEVIARNLKKDAITSDAITFQSLVIDTARYKLNKQSNAFGVRMNYSGSSHVNPLEVQYFNLYHFHHKKLTQTINDLLVYHFGGEQDDMGCASQFHEFNSILSLSQSETNHFADIIVTDKRSILTFKSLKGECVNEVVERPKIKFYLRYDGKGYVIPKIKNRGYYNY